MLSESILSIIEARGIDIELCSRLGLDECDKFGKNTLLIPYLEGGVVVNRKYRTITGDKKFAQDADARKVFWNVDCLSDATLDGQPLIITEGEFDAIAAIQAGYGRVVSVPDGAPSREVGLNQDSRKYSYIAEAQKVLAGVKEIILAVDSDGPGVNLLNDLSVRLGKARCKWVKYPKGCKDLNDALKRFGVGGVVETINRAQWMRVDGVYKMSELPPLPVLDGLDTGIPGLGKHFRLRPGDFSIVTGIPSHGKSSFVNEVADRMARSHGWKTAFASFEQKPQIDHRRALRTLFTGYRVIDCTPAQIAEADRWIDEMYSFIVPSEDDDVTLDWALERCAAAVVQHDAKLVVIDPWNEMDHIRPPDMTLTEYTGFAIKQFKKFSSKYQCHVMVVAHPAKMRREGDTIPVPTLYDISDSAHGVNKSDLGVVIHRVDENDTLVRVQKSRYHDQIGVPGDVHLTYNPRTGRYSPFRPLG